MKNLFSFSSYSKKKPDWGHFDHKKWVEMVKISDASYENEIHMVDSPFNEDSKNVFFLAREVLISGEGQPENLGKWPKTGKPIVM